MRKNSIKNIRINNEVRKELSNIISNEVKDPRISGLTSVTDVYVAPDLKTCKAYISVLGDAESGAAGIQITEKFFNAFSNGSSGSGTKQKVNHILHTLFCKNTIYMEGF